jgi:CheY-like chemotaxis protein
MRVLFLDDDENRHEVFSKKFHAGASPDDAFIAVRNVDECVEALKSKGPFDKIFLDHDLGGKQFVKETEGTGYQVALFIESELGDELLPPKVIVHSYNQAGAFRMVNAIKNRIYNVRWVPFGPEMLSHINS